MMRIFVFNDRMEYKLQESLCDKVISVYNKRTFLTLYLHYEFTDAYQF